MLQVGWFAVGPMHPWCLACCPDEASVHERYPQQLDVWVLTQGMGLLQPCEGCGRSL